MSSVPAFDRFVAPARGNAQIWRLLLGLTLGVVIFAAWTFLLIGGLIAVKGRDSALAAMEAIRNPVTPEATLIMLATFVGMALAPMAAVRLVHRRPIATLFGKRSKVLRHFALAALVVLAVYSGSMLFWSSNFDPIVNLPVDLWVRLLPFALLGVLIQTGAEELLFRSYLMQQLGARFTWRLVHMVLPAVLFGLLHYNPGIQGANAWAIVGLTAFFGLIAADLTAVTGNLGAAWGLHFANNVIALVILATQGAMSGLARFVTPYAASDIEMFRTMILSNVIGLIVVWATLRMTLRA